MDRVASAIPLTRLPAGRGNNFEIGFDHAVDGGNIFRGLGAALPRIQSDGFFWYWSILPAFLRKSKTR